jgi:hypothetical protein
LLFAQHPQRQRVSRRHPHILLRPQRPGAASPARDRLHLRMRPPEPRRMPQGFVCHLA